MKAKILLAAVAAAISLGVTAQTDTISASAAHRMLMEADNYLQAQPDGWQRRIETALRHALRGNGAELKTVRAERRRQSGTARPGVEERDVKVAASGTARLYMAEGHNENLPLLIYLTSDLWGAGGNGGAAEFCRDLAATGRLAVLALEQPANAYAVKQHAAAWGCDPRRVFVGGEGGAAFEAGCLVLDAESDEFEDEEDATEELAADGQVFRGMVLISPVVQLDDQQILPSRGKYGRTYGLDESLLEASIGARVLDWDPSRRPSSTLIVPGLWSGEGPVLLLSPERDLLFDEGRKLADTLRADGVSVERVVLPGAVYGVAGTDGQPTARAEVAKRVADFVGKN